MSGHPRLILAFHATYQRKPQLIRAKMESGQEVGFGFDPANDWIDVYTRSRRPRDVKGRYTGNYHEYGFSLSEWRWSRAQGPPGSDEIKRLIAANVPGATPPARAGAGCAAALVAIMGGWSLLAWLGMAA